MASLRAKFANWKKSREGKDVIRDILRQQLFTCPSCFKGLNHNNSHVHHLMPLSKLEEDDKRFYHYDNLVVLCADCNRKQSNKVDTRFD